MEAIVSNNIKINFLPWFDNGYILKSLYLSEQIGGTLANGTITLELVGTEESLLLVTKQFTGKLTIKKDKGDQYEIDIFITNRNYYKNTLVLNFICIKDKAFFTDLVSLEYSDITSALNSLYPGKIDIRCESDIDNDIPLIQFMETNQDFCNKLAYSFKKNIVFGYSWDRFFIKEKIGIDSRNNEEPKRYLVGNAGTELVDSYKLSYNSILFEKPLDPWLESEDNKENYVDLCSINSRTLKLFNNYVSVGSNYSNLMKNYLFNTTQLNTDMYVSAVVESSNIPEYRLGDTIYFKELRDKGLPCNIFLIKSNELSIIYEGKTKNQYNISMKSTLIGLEFGKERLPDTDPLDQINEEGLIP